MTLDGVPLVNLGMPLPCRYCHRPSYLAEVDDEKRLHPLHPCCRFWIEKQGHTSCLACNNSRRTGGRTPAQTPPGSSSASMPRPRPNSAPEGKKFDEDEGLLLVLAALRRSGTWVDSAQLLPFVGNRVDVLAQLSLVVEQRGTYYRINTGSRNGRGA